MQMNLNKHGPSSLIIGRAVAPMLSNCCWHPVFMHIFTLPHFDMREPGLRGLVFENDLPDRGIYVCRARTKECKNTQLDIPVNKDDRLTNHWTPLLSQASLNAGRDAPFAPLRPCSSASPGLTNTPGFFFFVHTHPRLHAHNGRHLEGETNLWARACTLTRVPKA